MDDITALKEADDRTIQVALGAALEAFRQSRRPPLPYREAALVLGGIPHAALMPDRVYKLKSPHTLRILATCRQARISFLAQALIDRLRIPRCGFDYAAAGAKLIHYGCGGWRLLSAGAKSDLSFDEAQQLAIKDLMFVYMKSAFFRELSQSRLEGVRCQPQFPLASFNDPTNAEQVDGDAVERAFLGKSEEDSYSFLFPVAINFDESRACDDLCKRIMSLCRREEQFVLEAVEGEARFNQQAVARTDKLAAAMASAEAFVSLLCLTGAVSALRQSVEGDRALHATPLARLLTALYSYARVVGPDCKTAFERSLAALPKNCAREKNTLKDLVDGSSMMSFSAARTTRRPGEVTVAVELGNSEPPPFRFLIR